MAEQWTWEYFIRQSPVKRRAMWSTLKKHDPDIAEYWEDPECCWEEDYKCQHLNDGWCEYAMLPCAVNPFLTTRTGMLGMACMGGRPVQQICLGL